MQIDHDPKTIEHIPNEKRPPKWIWKAGFSVVAILWVLQAFDGFVWDQLMLGLGTGVLIGLWAMEVTGGNIPESWRRQLPRR